MHAKLSDLTNMRKVTLFLLFIILTYLNANTNYNSYSDYILGYNLLCKNKYQGIYEKKDFLINTTYRCNNISRLDGVMRVYTPKFIAEYAYKNGVLKCRQKVYFNGVISKNVCKLKTSYKFISKNHNDKVVTIIDYAKDRNRVKYLKLYSVFKEQMLNITFDQLGNIKNIDRNSHYMIIKDLTFNPKIGTYVTGIEYSIKKNMLFTIYNVIKEPVLTVVYNKNRDVLAVKLYKFREKEDDGFLNLSMEERK